MSAVGRGRALLAGGDVAAVAVLRLAAQQSLDGLRAAQADTPQADAAPRASTGATSAGAMLLLRARAAQAHLWWGRAENRLGDRDRAITALTRAVPLFQARGDESVARAATTGLAAGMSEATRELSVLLRDGLPRVAPDDVLHVIASHIHGGLWKPLRFSFEVAIGGPGHDAVASRKAIANRDTPDTRREFLLTRGKLFPGEERTEAGSRLWRVPPLYAALPPDALPPVLKMDRTLSGYERQTAGAEAGLWRQTVRVFYASPFLTRGGRDDAPRAQALCAQLLQVVALMRAGAGVANRHAPDGVTTLWLCETPALWPASEDAENAGGVGPQQLGIPRENMPRDAVSRDAVSRGAWRAGAWRAGAWIESAPGDILLFRMNQPRHESEWLRELMHEYSHVALPPFAGFAPPLEPFGNGTVGETLGMLWKSGLSVGGSTSSLRASPTTSVALLPFLHEHLARNALPSLQFWNERGPSSPLRSQGTPDALRFLQGLTVGIERVYGPDVLSAAFILLLREQNAAQLRADALLTATETVLRSTLSSNDGLPIWLAGALETPPPSSRTATELAARAPLILRAGQRAQGWVYVPPTAGVLHVEWQALAAENDTNGVEEPRGTSRQSPALRVEGKWKTAPDSGTLPSGDAMPSAGRSATGVLRVSVNRRSGWQHFTFVAMRDLALGAARLERDAQPTINDSKS